MNSMFFSAAATAATSSATPAVSTLDVGAALVAAAKLLADFEHGRAIDVHALRAAMVATFGSSDSEGTWTWKTAYDVCEAAQIAFLRKLAPAMRARAVVPSAFLTMLAKLAAFVPSHTHRSQEGGALQQFSTPIGLGFVAIMAAVITPAGLVLEPSAGTGLLAIHAELAGVSLAFNELADTRACLLDRLLRSVAVTRHDAGRIHDHLHAAVYPSIVLMNPPFSVSAHADGRVADAAFRDLSSALARLAEGGRLVAITGVSLSPDNPLWCDAFVRSQELGRVVFSAAVHARVYARHASRIGTRVSAIDKLPADDRTVFPPSPAMALDAAVLLDRVRRLVPARPAVTAVPPVGRHKVAPIVRRAPAAAPSRGHLDRAAAVVASEPAGVEIAYETIDWMPADTGRLTEALYEGYALQSIRISGPVLHPTRLVQSAAVAAVAPPKPSYRPHLPPNVITGGLLSGARFESIIYAVDRLKAIGLISEIISWKLRLFLPTGAAGPEILAQLMERHPLIRIAHKAAA
jgi:predicted RNA methylase